MNAPIAGQRNMTPQQFGDEIGWDVDQVVSDPEALWQFNVRGLYDLRKALDLDWVSALPA